MHDVIGVFSGKGIKQIEKDGGSGFWKAKRENLEQVKYVLVVRNHRESWAEKKDGIERGQAYLIGRVKSIEDADDRKLIKISTYALLDSKDASFKEAWNKLTKGQRFPVTYCSTDILKEQLSLDVTKLDWRYFPQLPISEALTLDGGSQDLSQIIKEAKKVIAESAGVKPEQVDIKISF